MKKNLVLSALFLINLAAFSQTSSDSTATKPSLTFGGFVDAYYVYDFNEPANNVRPGFLYNHNRHNEFSINMALLKANYSSERVRANVGLMAGTYSEYNYAAEQGMMKNIYEANAGFKLANKLWLDAGIFASHIGYETAISCDNFNLTRSLSSENTPYYLSAAKLNYEINDKWSVTGLVMNGWQNIKETPGNSNKAVGTQLVFKPNSKLSFSSSTFIGNEKPDTAKQMRYFHDIYMIWKVTDKLSAVVLFDAGIEQDSVGSSSFNNWFNPCAVLKYDFAKKFAVGLRGEYYSDENGVIIATGTPNGFKTIGYSMNLDYHPVSNVHFRIEGRSFLSEDNIFIKGSNITNNNTFVAASFAVTF